MALFEQRQDVLRHRVRLRQHVLTRLLQNLRGAHRRNLGSVVSVRDLRFGSRQVGCRSRITFYCRFQTVLLSTQRTTSAVNGFDLSVDSRQCAILDFTCAVDQFVARRSVVRSTFQRAGNRTYVGQFQVDSLTVKCTNLQFGGQFGIRQRCSGSPRATQQLLLVERGVFTNAIHFLKTSINFVVDALTVFISVRAVSGLHDQLTYTLKVIRYCPQSAFSGLRHGHTVVGVAVGLLQTVDLRRHAVGNGQTRCVIFGAVDTLTRRQTFDRLVLCFLRFIQVVLSQLRKCISSNYLCHLFVSFKTVMYTRHGL
ncbi:phospholipid-binding protein [Zymobacter palmae]|uniref:Phospholipid-binding protein n=1 Tax=Zymobacter palmae TaxID=33074 RepID=A0A348HFD1_9GAMM|nr:phospholipid-binding protein [Zymobacter palmae]